MRDEVVTFIVAGHETVASALTWAWHLLGDAPDIADQVGHEAYAVLGDRLPTFDDVPALSQATAVFDEALRLYPPGWLISRKALADDVVDGHTIPAGALVLISPYLVHRHASAGPDVEQFFPDRFRTQSTSPATGVYIPFGAGPRLCIGREMARVEGTLVLSQVLRAVRLSPLPGAIVQNNPMVMLKPRGGLAMVIGQPASAVRSPRAQPT